MKFSDFMTFAGGLALFLYGMYRMGEGLSRSAGKRMEAVLRRFTGSPCKAVLAGTIVTALIQSSSATTVMTVEFVESGIMSTEQAVGVIMGANIGTTVTAWIIGISENESTKLFFRFLNPVTFAPMLALIGVGVLLFSHKERIKNIASGLVGFSILIFGMETMSDAVSPITEMPSFSALLVQLENPLRGMLAGALFTAVVQSSSASIGILQALSTTGTVTYRVAIPLIMGQNIGTCMTALLSCIGAGKSARQTAMVHLWFNVIGTGIFMLGYCGMFEIGKPVGAEFAWMSLPDSAADCIGIAVVHTVFNVASTIILLPGFIGVVGGQKRPRMSLKAPIRRF